MTPRDDKGRFVSAKPVLHRQVPDIIDHGPRISLALLVLIVAAVVTGLGICALLLGGL